MYNTLVEGSAIIVKEKISDLDVAHTEELRLLVTEHEAQLLSIRSLLTAQMEEMSDELKRLQAERELEYQKNKEIEEELKIAQDNLQTSQDKQSELIQVSV